MAKEFCVGKDRYRFDSHRRGYGYTSHVAVNVKCHIYLKLTDVQKKKIERFDRLYPDQQRSIEESLYDHCLEQVQRDWWEDAEHQASVERLGTISSEGRQGGWLVMNDWPFSRVEELLEDTEYRCAHCDMPEDNHVNEQCLFASTNWAPTLCLTPGTKNLLDRLSKYLSEIEESVENAKQMVINDFAYQLDQRYEEEFPQLELFDVLGETHG